MKKVLLFVGLALLVLIGSGYFFLRSYMPDYDEQLQVEGLEGRVVIRRNPWAVPTIEAQNLRDLYFAWGYVNAQDRLFQMDLTRRIGQGRISEFAGESAVAKDYFIRAVGFYEIAKREAASLSAHVKALLQRYVDGVNYFLRTHKRPLPMVLLGLPKEEWTLADPVVIGMMLNWSLAYNLRHELLFYRMARKLGNERAKRLLPFLPSDTPAILEEGGGSRLKGRSMEEKNARLGRLLGGRSASNNWAVAPEKTQCRGPILASDPHVHDSKIPSDFYLIRLEAGDFQLAGGQVAGVPIVFFGYNRRFAWGLTNQGADIVDLYLEEVDWDKETYIREGKEIPLSKKETTIRIKGRPPIKKTLFYAGRRPLLREVFPEVDRVLSLDWVGLNGVGVQGFFEMNRARTHEEWVRAIHKIRMTPQNLVYAETDGTIGYYTLGALPKRMPGTGRFPSEGKGGRVNWEGLVPPEENPALENPPSGFIATANNLVARTFPYDINPTVAPRYRIDRIIRMLEAKERIDVPYAQAMQMDDQSELAEILVPKILELVDSGGDGLIRDALNRLKEWDFRMRKDDPAPAIYNTFLVRFMYQTFVDELGPKLAAQYVGERYVSLERFLELLEEGSEFFDDVTTPQMEDPRQIATRAFREALEMLSEVTGEGRVEAWQWGKVHQIRFDHVLGNVKILRSLVNRGPYPVRGDCETNHRAHFTEVEPPFTAVLASGLRLVVEFDPDPRGYMVLITGQNEYFLSKHYDDMIDLWRAGRYIPLEEVSESHRTVMTPR